MAGTYDTRQGGDVSPERVPSSWAIGWTAFAGVMLLAQGSWWMVAGFVALVNGEFYVPTREYIFQFNPATWGWVHIIVGLVLFGAGMALFGGLTWARVVGVIVASLARLVAFAWLPWYPLWALLFIVISVSVIWALTVHGRDITTI
jgi:hypothetical protein